MKTILVSLVSEHTIPNILIAAHYKSDILWFISTKKMEDDRKTMCIEDTLRLKGLLPTSNNVKTIMVDQDSLTDCMSNIEALIENISDDVEYIINITGGNKVMALAAFEIFREIGEKVVIGYMPINRNEFIQIFPKKRPLKINEIKGRLNLEEYLMSYGFRIQNKDKLQITKSKSLSHKETSQWILDNYEQLKGVLGFLFKELREKRKRVNYRLAATFNNSLSGIERDFLIRQGFQIRDRMITKDLKKDEIIYLTGGWFEETMFNELYGLSLNNLLDDVMIGPTIESGSGAVNELDVAFMKNNVFYHIECKTLGEWDVDRKVINEELYKKGAISTLLGKGEKRAIICTTLNDIKEPLSKRAKDYGVEVLPIQEVRNLKERLLSKFKGTG